MQATPRQTLSVSQLAALIRGVLEDSFASVWVEGEVSGYKAMPSGHWYFALKDASAELKVAMFKGRNVYSQIAPKNGERLRVRGRVTIYDARGELQMIADQLESAGAGDLQREFEARKARLQAEGLFDAAHKRALPSIPHRIAVLTSPQGAAISDVMAVLTRRFPLLQVELWPSLVQGEQAAQQLLARVQEIKSVAERYDLLLITRGGGAAQDLFCFNDEALVRALAQFPIPVVSAIGHEVDFTLVDFVADVRAATPSAAAELIAPDQQRFYQHLQQLALRMQRNVHTAIEQRTFRLERALRLLQALAPMQRMQADRLRLQNARQRLLGAMRIALQRKLSALSTLTQALNAHDPNPKLQLYQQRLAQLQPRLLRAWRDTSARSEQALQHLQQRLHTLSPERTLERGYALVLREQNVISDVASLQTDERLTLRMRDGQRAIRVLPTTKSK
jgi:exodeoxyribonuclease VII large subunit